MKPGFIDKILDRIDRIDPAEARQLLDRLVREKGFLEQVFEALHEGVIVLSNDGTITFINAAACRLFGLEPDSATGSPLPSRLPGLDWNSLAKPGTTVSRDLEIFYPDHRFLNFYLSPLVHSDAENPSLGWVMLVRDITTSRQEAEQNLESERLNALTLLAASVAHEIGNPLNSLDIHLQLLARKLRKLPTTQRTPLEQHLDTARQEIQRLDVILRQFLQAIRPSSPTRERSDLNQLILDSLRLLETELASRHITVELDLDPELPQLDVDHGQLQQAFYNLIRNAYQAIPASQGHIILSSGHNDYEIRLAISDNGTGISPEHMGSLFEPFHTTKPSGTGLGLLIVRRIVREHGGEIEIHSEPGAGTRVTIHLPRGPKPVRLLGSSNPVIDVD